MSAGAANAAHNSSNRFLRTLPTAQLAAAAQSRLSALGARLNSPWDLTDNGGRVVTSATSHNVYVNCATTPAKCWGTVTLTPATFLRDLNVSQLLHVADQYLHESAPGQFDVSELKTTVKFADSVPVPTASVDDILSIVFSASQFTHASGYHHIFHIFLPKGTDMCITATECYSPDNPSTFVFCAFHSSVDFGPNQHVLFSVEPYQFVGGCVLPTQTRVIDGTASSLSHEFFETITDPDGSSWINELTGNEIGDLCFGFRNGEQIGPRKYTVQEEYSNAIHDCTDRAR